MKFVNLSLLAMAVACGSALAEESPTSRAYSECIVQAAAVDPAVLDCMSDEFERQDRALNEEYGRLLKKLSPTRGAKLKQAQRQWLKYVETNCDFYFDPEGGSAARQAANECAIQERARRVAELRSLGK